MFVLLKKMKGKKRVVPILDLDHMGKCMTGLQDANRYR